MEGGGAVERLTDREVFAEYRRKGSPDLYGEIVARYANTVFATCLRVLGDRHTAEDATQAAFLVLLRKGRKLASGTVLVDWLHRAARNCARNLRKTEARRARHEREAMTMRQRTEPGASWEAARPHLDAALDSLPARQREALALRYLRGLSRAEVAAELGCPERTAESRLRLGMEKLRARLSRRGAAVPAAALAGLLGEQLQAPATLTASIQALSLGTATATAAATATAEAIMKAMFWAKVKICAAAVVASAVVFGGGGLLAAGVGGSGKAKSGKKPKAITLDWKKINAQAAKEYLTPLRPGVPGKQLFWNPYARRFLYVPAFEFKPVKGAKYYRFTVSAKKGRKKHVFEAPEPWAPLTQVWKDMRDGWYGLKVEGLTAKGGDVVGTAKIANYGSPKKPKPPKDVEERVLRKAAGFKGPHEILTSREYRESALRCLRFIRECPYYKQFKEKGKYKCRHWITHHVSACISGMSYLAKHAAEVKEKEEALTMARNAADYLISISFPEGQALAHISPMSSNRKWVKMNAPSKAGHAYLDLYDACEDEKYLLAAKQIADVYKKLQLPSGTWHYVIAPVDGKATAKDELLPGKTVYFLDRLVNQYGCKQYEKTAAAAMKWLLENPFKTYDWKGQFADVGADRPPYSNQTRYCASPAAECLLKRVKAHPQYLSLAEDAMRFGEDQFTWWGKTPFVREQYVCFTAVNGSIVSMVRAYLRLYEATGKDQYLAKAIALANTIVKTQTEDGCYPTWVFKGKIASWPNCVTVTAVLMIQFADFMEKEEKKRAGK